MEISVAELTRYVHVKEDELDTTPFTQLVL
jgi:hypothetical protein